MQVPAFTSPPPSYAVHAEVVVEVPADHGLVIENLLDLAHAPFTHTTAFARSWPLVPPSDRPAPDTPHAATWQPHPISMSFQPPCGVVSTIGLAPPGSLDRGARVEECARHLHQLHVCLPSKPGHTRLLCRMSLDFTPLAKMLPGADALWLSAAKQALRDDLALLTGQPERRQQEGPGSGWARPAAYDRLATRYRTWRSSMTSGSSSEEKVAVSAVESFAMDDPVDDLRPPPA